PIEGTEGERVGTVVIQRRCIGERAVGVDDDLAVRRGAEQAECQAGAVDVRGRQGAVVRRVLGGDDRPAPCHPGGGDRVDDYHEGGLNEGTGTVGGADRDGRRAVLVVQVMQGQGCVADADLDQARGAAGGRQRQRVAAGGDVRVREGAAEVDGGVRRVLV